MDSEDKFFAIAFVSVVVAIMLVSVLVFVGARHTDDLNTATLTTCLNTGHTANDCHQLIAK